MQKRYFRNLGTIGEEGQKRLLSSHVAIIGVGGLGGVVLEILARFGIGRISIADYDIFEESNLNRQLLATTENLGIKKVEAANKRVREINPSVEIITYAERITSNNIDKVISGANVVADCIDGLPDRFIIEKAAKNSNIPLVHAAISGFSGQVTTIFSEDEGLKLIYGEASNIPQRGSETIHGTPPTTVLQTASWQANEIIKILLGKNDLLRNKLLLIDMNSTRIKQLRLPT